MKHSFTYSVSPSSKQTRFAIEKYEEVYANLLNFLAKKKTVNETDYNTILRGIKTRAQTISCAASALFKQELTLIQKKKPLTESTIWGGVTLKKIDTAKDFIQKHLIIKNNSVLGFEIHKKKHEHLQILQGYCFVFWINHHGKPNRTISVQLAGPKDEFTFEPKDEHGILSLSNCIIEETSTNHLDDLVYIFKASL